MKQYRVAILGASGAVGQEMMKILAERKFPVGELHLLASARSAGKVVSWQGQNIALEEATDAAFAGMDIVLGAAENDIAERFAPAIVRSGAVFVDNSSAFRLDPNVPLVVPEINAGDVKLHHGIISNPNCSTIITLTAINALRKLSPIRDMVVSTYQAVSGAGAGGPIELQNEVDALRASGQYFAWDVVNSDRARLGRIIDQLVNGTFAAQSGNFESIHHELMFNNDYDLVLKDFHSYVDAWEKLTAAYPETQDWNRRALHNTAMSGWFSSDRTIREYRDEIWHA